VNGQASFPQTERLILLPGLLLAALALAYLPLDDAAGLVVLVGGALTLLRWPWLVWPLLGASLPFAAAQGVGRISLADMALAGAVTLWFADGVRRRSLRIAPSPLVGLTLLWIAAQCASLLAAADLVEGGAEVVKWVEFGVILAIAPVMLTARQGRWLIVGLLLGGAGQALLGLYQFVNRIGPDWFIILGRFMRASGSFGQPNPYGGYLGLCLPVAVSLALWAWGQVWQPVQDRMGESDRPLRERLAIVLPACFFSVVSLLLLTGILASWSRGAWLGVLAGLAVVLALRSRTALLVSSVAALVGLAALLLGSFRPAMIPAPLSARMADVPAYLGLTDVLSQPVTDENFSVVERVAHWAAAMRMWEQAPWFGIGPGNYAVAYPSVRLPRWEDALGHAHNVYLNVLAETGVIGLAAFLILWIGIVVWLWRHFRRAEARSYEGALALGVLGVVAHLSVHNLVDNLFVQGMTLHLALLLAAVEIEA
jgi:putative inorganic carbon (HCO3(-)) transporter